jgi:hypothetical protein
MFANPMQTKLNGFIWGQANIINQLIVIYYIKVKWKKVAYYVSWSIPFPDPICHLLTKESLGKDALQSTSYVW